MYLKYKWLLLTVWKACQTPPLVNPLIRKNERRGDYKANAHGWSKVKGAWDDRGLERQDLSCTSPKH